MSDHLPAPHPPVPSAPTTGQATLAPPAPPPLPSKQVVVQAPMSFTGSAKRIRNQVARWESAEDTIWQQIGWAILVIAATGTAWCGVLLWYCIFGLLLVPYRMVRRGQRNRGLEDQRHAEMMAAIGHAQRPGGN